MSGRSKDLGKSVPLFKKARTTAEPDSAPTEKAKTTLPNPKPSLKDQLCQMNPSDLQDQFCTYSVTFCYGSSCKRFYASSELNNCESCDRSFCDRCLFDLDTIGDVDINLESCMYCRK